MTNSLPAIRTNNSFIFTDLLPGEYQVTVASVIDEIVGVFS